MKRDEVIETTAGEVAAELARRGIASDERVTITIEPASELIPGRRESRARVVAAGLSDSDRSGAKVAAKESTELAFANVKAICQQRDIAFVVERATFNHF